MMTMKQHMLFLVLLGLLSTSRGSAQIYPGLPTNIPQVDSTTLDELPTFGWGIHSYFGGVIGSFQGQMYPNMNRFLKQQGIPQDWINENYFLGFGVTKGRFKLDLEINTSVIFGPERNERYLSQASTRTFSAHPALGIFKTRNRTLYLQTGVGWMETDLIISPRQSNVNGLSFNQIANVPIVGSYPILRHESLVMDFGIQLIHTAKRSRDLVESFRIGYRTGFQEKAWASPGLTISGTPIDRAGLIYFQTHLQVSNNFKKK